MVNRNLLDLDLQKFSEDEVADVEVSETVEPTEDTEVEDEETGEEEVGDAEPQRQSAEENARYAAIRRRAEMDARRRYEAEIDGLNQQVAAMCQGVTHPLTGEPITNVRDYMDALAIQQRQASEAELEEKGVDPALIDRMIASNPVVMQAQQVIEQTKSVAANAQLQRDLAAITQYDPNVKSIHDLAVQPNFRQMLNLVGGGLSLVDAYKTVNFDNYMHQTNDVARQQAINQMRGKDHLTSQAGVSQEEDYTEVPQEIMSRWKSEGKTEKQIRDLYKSVANKLHIN